MHEDEEGVREFAREILQTSGYTVLESRHGGQALFILKRFGGTIDLSVTGVVVPEISGRDLVGRCGCLRSERKILHVSGHTDKPILHDARAGRRPAWLQRPVTLTGLAPKVREVLDAPR